MRFTLAIFLISNLYMGVLVFSAFRSQILSREEAVYDYGPYILPVATLGSIAAYVTARRRLEAINESTFLEKKID